MKKAIQKVGVIMGVLLALTGCNSTAPKKLGINIAYDPVTIERLRVFPTVEVDIVEANETMLKQLEATSIDDYFDPDNMLRDSLRRKTFYFGEEDNGAKKLEKSDKIWDTWIDKHGASHVVLFANLARDGAKGPDMRRLTLPLAKNRWKSGEINVSIIPAGLMLQTPMNPED